MKIVQMLIPAHLTQTRPGISMVPKYITIHETGNTNKGANALSHARLQQSGNSRQASWHFTVDSGTSIYQSIPTNEISWNAGDGHGPGNFESISIEICVNSDGDFTKAKENAIELIKSLMSQHAIPFQNIVPHQRWSGKNCPTNILKSGWDAFKEPLLAPPPYPGHLIQIGDNGDLVKKVQEKLGGLVIDGIFGKLTLAKVILFQRDHKLKVDGIVGPQTWDALFGKTK